MKAKTKFLFVVIVLIVIAAAVIAIYLLAKQNTELREISDVRNEVLLESARCEEMISSGTGVFGEFEYCERYLNWSGQLELN